jgi:hypothetical protein
VAISGAFFSAQNFGGTGNFPWEKSYEKLAPEVKILVAGLTSWERRSSIFLLKKSDRLIRELKNLVSAISGQCNFRLMTLPANAISGQIINL